MRHTSCIPHPAHNIPHTTTRLLRSAEENALLREQLAAKDKEIEELTKALGKTKVGTGPPVVGLWTSHNKKVVRKVFEGPNDGCYYKTNTGNKIYLDPDEWDEMSEANVEKRIAAHEAKADSKIIGLHTSKDKKKVRPVFQGPKNGIFIETKNAKTMLKPGDYEPMDADEVNKRIEEHEAWLVRVRVRVRVRRALACCKVLSVCVCLCVLLLAFVAVSSGR